MNINLVGSEFNSSHVNLRGPSPSAAILAPQVYNSASAKPMVSDSTTFTAQAIQPGLKRNGTELGELGMVADKGTAGQSGDEVENVMDQH